MLSTIRPNSLQSLRPFFERTWHRKIHKFNSNKDLCSDSRQVYDSAQIEFGGEVLDCLIVCKISPYEQPGGSIHPHDSIRRAPRGRHGIDTRGGMFSSTSVRMITKTPLRPPGAIGLKRPRLARIKFLILSFRPALPCPFAYACASGVLREE
jgi:hypothetical protein